MNAIILTVIISLISLILLTATAILIAPTRMADFSLGLNLFDQDLSTAIFILASETTKVTRNGESRIPLQSVRKTLRKCYKIISVKAKNNAQLKEYELILYNDYYKLVQLLENLSKQSDLVKNLPKFGADARIYTLCKFVVRYYRGNLNEEKINNAVKYYNRTTALKHDEIEFLPTALGFCLIEYITAVCLRIINRNHYSKLALDDSQNGGFRPQLVFSPEYITSYYAYASEKGRKRADKVCFDNGVSLQNYTTVIAQKDEFYHKIVSNTVKTVYALDKILSINFVQSLSPVDEILNELASYKVNSTATKRYLCSKISRIGTKKSKSETAIAMEIVGRCKANGINECDILLPKRENKWLERGYALGQIVVSIILSLLLFRFLPSNFIVRTTAFLLIFLTTVKIIDLISLKLTPERFLPSIDEREIKNTAVIVKTVVLGSVNEVKRAIFDLKVIAHANPSDKLTYALLVDFPTAKTKTSTLDDEILSAIKTEYENLNEKFNIIVRKRAQAKSGLFHGKERKRGALMQLNELILHDKTADFSLILGNTYRQKYVIALDSDSVIRRAQNLICYIEHPWASRFALMSTSAVTLPSSANKTPYSALFCDENTPQNYAYRHDDAHFALFCSGNYTGKGIYDVAKFTQKLNGFFPDERILSHDYIEGAVVGCANAPVKIYDETPSTFAKNLSRRLRWTRGDWQLLPYLFGRVENQNGNKIKNPIKPINQWRILLNMIFALEPLFSLVLVFLSAIFASNTLILLALAPQILPLALNLLHPTKPLKTGLYTLITLPSVAITLTRGVIVTLVRLIRKEKLLEWTISSNDRFERDYGITQIFTALALVIFNTLLAKLPLVYIIASLFAIGGAVINLCDEKYKSRKISPQSKSYINLIAERTWKFFSESVNSSVNFLPPDHYDERAEKGYAYRTSPTNIGMYLASVFCAYKLNIISLAVAQNRIADTISTVEKLEKFNGNLYNWYDVKTLTPLPPRYLSFVDSGNFICSLLLVKTIADEVSAKVIDRIITECNFLFYYDEKSGLCSVGYNTETGTFDGNYDLYASESLITYLLCVGFNKLPDTVFEKLSSRRYRAQGNTLCSWTGGAFEYLLTPQFFRYEKSTALFESAINSIKAQKYLAKKCGRSLWGISECQHNNLEDNGDYGYKAFGVGQIALSQTVEQSVVSLYGGMLALPFDADSENLLIEYANKNLIGKYGLYESIDKTVVKSYMAHHQGMIMLAITNLMLDNEIVKQLRTYPQIVSLDPILGKKLSNEKCPKKQNYGTLKNDKTTERRINKNLAYEEFATYGARDYNFVISSRGNGYSMLNKIELTRKRSGTGMLVFARNNDFNLNLLKCNSVVFTDKFAQFARENETIKCATTLYATTVFKGGQVCKISIINKTTKPVSLDLALAVIPTLTNHDSDLAHEEFISLGIVSKKDFGGVYATRRDLSYVYFVKCLSNSSASYSTSSSQFWDKYNDYNCPYQLDTTLSSSVTLSLKPKRKTEIIFVATVIDKKALNQKILDKNLQISELTPSEQNSNSARVFSRLTTIFNSTGSIADNELSSLFDLRYPIVNLTAYSMRSMDKINDELSALTHVAKVGAKFNLALRYNESNIYFTPVLDALKCALARYKLNEILTGGRIQIINESTNEKIYNAVEKNCLPPALKNHEVFTNLRKLSRPKRPVELVKEEVVTPLGLGGFTANGEYYLYGDEISTPKPWSNILSNGKIGSLTTTSGEGYTFIGNSQLNKVTDFSSKNNGEFVIIGEDDEYWSISKNPLEKNANYDTTFSPNKTRYRCGYNETISSLTHFLGHGKSKFALVSITNKSDRERNFKVALVLSLAMAQNSEYGTVALERKVDRNRIYIYNTATGFSAFVDCSNPIIDYAFSLSAYRNCEGEIVKLSNADHSIKGEETVIVTAVKIKANETQNLCFAISQNENLDISAYRSIYAENERNRANLSPFLIENGLKSLQNLYLWLPTQALNCRFWARCGYYQTSGAYGFRDQLQDGMAVVYFNPKIVREHILLCAGAQFAKGDVLHWFFDDYSGVRSNYSDDKLFLVWATTEYIERTGDSKILDELIPYLNGENAPVGTYKKFVPSHEFAPLITHLIRAIDSVEYGKNSLAKMLGGDWNDGMNGIGKSGEGESVFTTMLTYLCLRKILPYLGESKRSEYAKLSVKLSTAVNEFYFDGYYARAVLGDGKILGTKECDSCKIDLLTQAFAVISGIAPRERALSALEIAYKTLYDEKNKTLNLLAPPFTKCDEKIGYITTYPPFVRENGAQYTHSAVWFIKACYEIGKTETAKKLLDSINPTLRSKTTDGVNSYKTEPFVMTADVYGGPYGGAGGWSWYTGAGAWTYKLITEQVLGINLTADSISFNPNLGNEEKVQLKIKTEKATFTVILDNGNRNGKWTVFWNKLNFGSNTIKLSQRLNGATLTVRRV